MPTDKFSNFSDSPTASAREAFAIVPNDISEIARLPKALLIGGAGTVVLRAIDSTADVTIAAVAGQILPVRAQFIRATGTTATGIVGLA